MSRFELDPGDGPHAASGLSNDQLEYLHHIVSLEMAVRMKREDFIEHFQSVVDERKQQDDMVDEVRKDRDRIQFVASVRADLANLPLTTKEAGECGDGKQGDGENPGQSYGMYL
jgi:hypothetical protein